MNRFSIFLVIFISGILIFSCRKNDNDKIILPKDRGGQYAEDIHSIETFLDTHYIQVDQDFNVTFATLPLDGSKVSIREQKEYPLQYKMVKNDTRVRSSEKDLAGTRIDDPINYKVYYIHLREGSGKESPVKVDSVFLSYKGTLLNNLSFTHIPNAVWINLDVSTTKDPKTAKLIVDLKNGGGGAIPGMRNMLTLFKPSDPNEIGKNSDGTINYGTYGAGVFFIPSGLGYFNNASNDMPAYSPLIFAIKLITFRHIDHDGDGILSIYEDIKGTGDFYDSDTDGDGIPDFLDDDDDGDGYSTRSEITNENGKLYSFESIPNCPGRFVKKHLDPNCH